MPGTLRGPLVIGIDEYQMYFYEVLADGRTAFFRTDGSFAKQFPATSIGGARVTAASRSLLGDFVAVATADGRASLQQVRFVPRYEDQKLQDLDVSVRDRGVVTLDPGGRPVREVAYEETEGRKLVAGVVAGDEIAVFRTDDEGAEHRATLRTNDGERVTRVRIGRSDTLVASTEEGNLYHWELTPEVRLTEVAHVSGQPITALEYVLGNITAIVGDSTGALGGWFRVREKDEDPDLRFAKAHTYPGQGTAICAIGASTRDKSFVTGGADGSVVLRHMTSGRSLVSFPATGSAVDAVLLTPKMDGIIVKQADGKLARYEIRPHPEISWAALFGRSGTKAMRSPSTCGSPPAAPTTSRPSSASFPSCSGRSRGRSTRSSSPSPSRSWARSTPRSSCTRRSRPR
jgi:phosphate transport system permease protein